MTGVYHTSRRSSILTNRVVVLVMGSAVFRSRYSLPRWQWIDRTRQQIIASQTLNDYDTPIGQRMCVRASHHSLAQCSRWYSNDAAVDLDSQICTR